VPGVPAGVLLTTGDGHGWYFTQAAGGSYTSPNGPFAFDTLTSAGGGGWQLVDKFGTTFNFNSAGGLTSRVERTGETTSYNSSGGLVTSIIDEFGRAVNLGYSSGQLSERKTGQNDFRGSVHGKTIMTDRIAALLKLERQNKFACGRGDKTDAPARQCAHPTDGKWADRA
jgi:hypothetical protein